MKLICKFGEMWARNQENINKVPVKEGGKGICILYDGSMPVYVGKSGGGKSSKSPAKIALAADNPPAFSRLSVCRDSVIVHPQFWETLVKKSCAWKILLGALLTITASRALAQPGPEGASSEWQVWTGGGHGINGSTSDTGVWNLGLRYGIVITSPHGPGFLRGQLEYALDVVPAWVIVQKTNTAYGGGVNPFAFKWILTSPKKVKPYFEIEGGTLFTNTKVPEGTSQINFTSSGAFGVHFLRAKHNFSAEARFMHISNAGMTKPNPGINTIQVRIGFGAFRR